MITIDRLREELSHGISRGWQLVGGRIAEDVPPGSATLPQNDHGALGPNVVLARLDSEEIAPWSRPILTRTDLGRDFWLGDGTGRALVRVGDGGYLHPDVELHLDAPVADGPNEVQENEDDEVLRRTYVRVLRTGDEVYVWGRPRLGYETAGYRDSALVVEFSPRSEVHLYDAPAYRHKVVWRSLPWYRKLSVLVRNR